MILWERGYTHTYMHAHSYTYMTNHVKWTKECAMHRWAFLMLCGRKEYVSYLWRWIGPFCTVPVFCILWLPSWLCKRILWINLHLCFPFSYGRVYAADPYHHTLAPAPTYGVGAMVSTKSSSSSLLPTSLPFPSWDLRTGWRLTSSHFPLIEFVSCANLTAAKMPH